jgi:hemerythrin-like domain-containing protein
MDRQDVAQQTQVEHEMVKHVMQALRVSAGWPVPGPDASRKLSTLRFIVPAFQRHLEHLLTLEEHDGYMDLVARTAPWLGRSTDALRAEHDRFRAEARQLVQRLEGLPTTDSAGLEKFCADLLALLGKIEEHNGEENALILEALARDEGGEG